MKSRSISPYTSQILSLTGTEFLKLVHHVDNLLKDTFQKNVHYTSMFIPHTSLLSDGKRIERQKACLHSYKTKKDLSHLKKKMLWQSGNSSALEDERYIVLCEHCTCCCYYLQEEDPIVLNTTHVQSDRQFLPQRPHNLR